MTTISKHIANIQTLAAQLTEVQNDQQHLDKILDAITRETRDTSYAIEDAPSRIAKGLMNIEAKGKQAVTLFQAASMVSGGHAHLCIYRMRQLIRQGKLPVVRKHKKLYANHATLTEWFRLPHYLR